MDGLEELLAKVLVVTKEEVKAYQQFLEMALREQIIVLTDAQRCYDSEAFVREATEHTIKEYEKLAESTGVRLDKRTIESTSEEFRAKATGMIQQAELILLQSAYTNRVDHALHILERYCKLYDITGIRPTQEQLSRIDKEHVRELSLIKKAMETTSSQEHKALFNGIIESTTIDSVHEWQANAVINGDSVRYAELKQQFNTEPNWECFRERIQTRLVGYLCDNDKTYFLDGKSYEQIVNITGITPTPEQIDDKREAILDAQFDLMKKNMSGDHWSIGDLKPLDVLEKLQKYSGIKPNRKDIVMRAIRILDNKKEKIGDNEYQDPINPHQCLAYHQFIEYHGKNPNKREMKKIRESAIKSLWYWLSFGNREAYEMVSKTTGAELSAEDFKARESDIINWERFILSTYNLREETPKCCNSGFNGGCAEAYIALSELTGVHLNDQEMTAIGLYCMSHKEGSWPRHHYQMLATARLVKLSQGITNVLMQTTQNRMKR